MDSVTDPSTALALLEWQVELGADEAICDAPIDRYALPVEAPRATTQPESARPVRPASSTTTAAPRLPETRGKDATRAHAIDVARTAAAAATDLGTLAAAMAAYEHCELKRGARNLVFADGNPAARVMIIGEAPGRDEDQEGRPFVGKAGQLLDRMFAAIGLGRTSPDPQTALYITNVMPWRPPSNRTPDQAEIAMMLPFLHRHIALIGPDVIVLMGNTPCQALLGQGGITRIRGQWTTAQGCPTLPMLHPAYLFRQPLAKRESWADLLALQAHLKGQG